MSGNEKNKYQLIAITIEGKDVLVGEFTATEEDVKDLLESAAKCYQEGDRFYFFAGLNIVDGQKFAGFRIFEVE